MSLKKILVVDDDSDLLDVVEDYLEEYNVCRGSSGRDGIEKMTSQSIDLVITDVHMPDGNGYAFLEFLKVEFPNVPVILMSGVDDIDVAQESLDRGAITFIFKPFDRSELGQAVEKALSKI